MTTIYIQIRSCPVINVLSFIPPINRRDNIFGKRIYDFSFHPIIKLIKFAIGKMKVLIDILCFWTNWSNSTFCRMALFTLVSIWNSVSHLSFITHKIYPRCIYSFAGYFFIGLILTLIPCIRYCFPSIFLS